MWVLQVLAGILIMAELFVILMFFQAIYLLIRRVLTGKKNYWYVEILLAVVLHILTKIISALFLRV